MPAYGERPGSAIDPRFLRRLGPGRDLRIAPGVVRLLALDLPREHVEAGFRGRGALSSVKGQSALIIDVTSAAGSALRSLCRWAALELDKPDTPLAFGPTAEHLDQTLLTLFFQSVVSGVPSSAASRGDMLGKVKLSDLEGWIPANLREPISVETLAGVASSSTRALQMTFRRYRDCTPMEFFVRRARLQEVRRQIRSRGPGVSVTEIALDFGFFHLGRFAHAYQQLFGERPSETSRDQPAHRASPSDIPED